MSIDFNLTVDFSDRSALVYHHSGSIDSHVGFTVVHLLSPDPVTLEHLLVCVAEKREVQILFVDEFPLKSFVIRADAEHYGALLRELFIEVAKIAGFACSAGGQAFGVEEKNNMVLIFIIIKADNLSC